METQRTKVITSRLYRKAVELLLHTSVEFRGPYSSLYKNLTEGERLRKSPLGCRKTGSFRKGLSCFHLGLASPFLEKTRSSIQQLDIYITHNMGFKVLLVILKLSLHFDSQTSLMNGQDRFYYPCFIIEETEARELK